MEHLIEFLVFSGKVIIIVAGLLVVISGIVSLAAKGRSQDHLEVENLNEKYEQVAEAINSQILEKKQFKALLKNKKKQLKNDKKQEKPLPHLFVLEFEGDIKASHLEQLRDEITSVLTVASPSDEVVVCVESPGGMVHSYGLAAAQLSRFKERGIKLTVCVDKVAASGGYMMACVADKIVAAPFAILGSIGVLAQVPNFNKLLKKNNVEFEEITAGEYKRTMSLLGEITDKGRQKFTEQIEDTHKLFKDFVNLNRPQLDIAKVATGETWYGVQAKDMKLIDEIKTSDDYLFDRKDQAKIFKIKYKEKQKLGDKLASAMGKMAEKVSTHFKLSNLFS